MEMRPDAPADHCYEKHSDEEDYPVSCHFRLLSYEVAKHQSRRRLQHHVPRNICMISIPGSRLLPGPFARVPQDYLTSIVDRARRRNIRMRARMSS